MLEHCTRTNILYTHELHILKNTKAFLKFFIVLQCFLKRKCYRNWPGFVYFICKNPCRHCRLTRENLVGLLHIFNHNYNGCLVLQPTHSSIPGVKVVKTMKHYISLQMPPFLSNVEVNNNHIYLKIVCKRNVEIIFKKMKFIEDIFTFQSTALSFRQLFWSFIRYLFSVID